MLLRLIPIAFLFSAISSFGQQFSWAENMGGTMNEYGRSVSVGIDGDIYIAGFFQGTIDADPGSGTFNLISTGGYDVFILRMTATGALVWAKSIGGTGSEYGYTIETDSSGNVYVAGRFEGTADFDPGTGTYNLTSAGSADIFVLKLNNSGSFVWASGMGGPLVDQVNSMKVDDAGNVFAAGVFRDTADFDPGTGIANLISAGGEDIFAFRLSTSGNLDWAKRVGSTGSDRAYSLAADPAGNVFLTGVFSGTVDFDPGTGTSPFTSAGNFDAYVLKLDGNGDYLWAKSFGGTSYDFGYGISTDNAGNVFTTGYFQSSANFDPGTGTTTLVSAGNYDIFLQKLDAQGDFEWANSMGGTGDDRGYSVATDEFGSAYVTGYFIGAADFDPTAATDIYTAFGMADFYVQKTDSAGNYQWNTQMGGSSHDFGLGLAMGSDGDIYITGNYEGAADFDPEQSIFTLAPVSGSDVFALKLKQCNTYADIQVFACGSYTSPSGDFTWSTSGTYTDIVPNSEGCDSIIAIDLSLGFPSFYSFSTTACDSYLSPGGTHVWDSTGTYIDTLVNSSGCDSIVTVALIINHSYETHETQRICKGDSVMLGGSFQHAGGVYTDTLLSSGGCDSIIYTDLTVTEVDISTIQSGLVLEAVLSGAGYQWLDCENSYAPLGDETAQQFSAEMDGEYAVEITSEGCVDTSSCMLVTAFGMGDKIDGLGLSYFPNPVISTLQIILKPQVRMAKIRLFSSDNKTVYLGETTGKPIIHIPMEELPSGVYILKVETTNRQEMRQVIKL